MRPTSYERLESRRVLASFSFSPPEPVASYDGDVAMIRPADLDNDGDEDIVFLDVANSSIHVIENISHGVSFSEPQLLGIVPAAYEFEIVDMDNDNDLDIVAARTSLVIFENRSLGRLEFHTVDRPLPMADEILRFRVADWDSDGDQDVIVGFRSRLSIYLDHDGVFERNDLPREIAARWPFDVGDVDHDGDLEIVTQSLLLERTGNTVTKRLDYGICYRPVIVDATGDGRNDVLCNSQGGMRIHELNAEAETLAPLFRYRPYTGGVLDAFVADFDLDGTPEVGGSSRDYQGHIGVAAINPVTERYEFVSFYAAHAQHRAKINADEAIDIVAYEPEINQISWYRNRVFSDSLPIDATILAQDISAADVDGDGDIDVIAAGHEPAGLFWYEATTSGTFLPRQRIPLPNGSERGPRAIQTTDINHDGKAEVILLDRSHELQILEFESNEWRATSTEFHVPRMNFIKTIDWNQDGFEDVVLGDDRGAPLHILQFSPTLERYVHIRTTDTDIAELTIADIDKDGDRDIIAGKSWIENAIDRDSFASPNILLFADPRPTCVIRGVADFDGDGVSDLFCGTTVFSLNEDGAYAASNLLLDELIEGFWKAELADLDQDGRMDLAFPGGWYANDVNQLSNRSFNVGFEDHRQRLFDIDVDGDSDVLSIGPDREGIYWIRNHLPGTRNDDLNQDGVVDLADLNAICVAVRENRSDEQFDVDRDGTVDANDVQAYHDKVLNNVFGDLNSDGAFDSSDLILLFQAGQYEDGVEGNSVWSTGDWNCDGEFDSSDLVIAFQKNNYKQ